MRALVAAGLRPTEAIRAATRSAAALLGVEAEIGAVAEGSRADLVLATGDPRADLDVPRQPAFVTVGGRLTGDQIPTLHSGLR